MSNFTSVLGASRFPTLTIKDKCEGCHDIAVTCDDGTNKQGLVANYKVSPEYILKNEVLIY